MSPGGVSVLISVTGVGLAVTAPLLPGSVPVKHQSVRLCLFPEDKAVGKGAVTSHTAQIGC